MKNKYLTSCWKLSPHENQYRFQSDDPVVINKMRRRADFDLVAWGENILLEIYNTLKSTPQKAQRTMSRLTSSEVKKDAENGVFYAKIYPIVTKNDGCETSINVKLEGGYKNG